MLEQLKPQKLNLMRGTYKRDMSDVSTKLAQNILITFLLTRLYRLATQERDIRAYHVFYAADSPAHALK